MSDFKRIKINNVEFKYPRVDKLYRFDPTAKNEDSDKMGKSVPATADDMGANWSLGFHLDKKRSSTLYNKAVAHFAESQGPKAKFKTVAGTSELEDGSIIFRAKRNAKTKSGKLSEPPAILNGNGKELDDKAFADGSKGNIIVGLFPANNPDAKGMGISIYLIKAEVTDPKYREDDAEDLDDVKPEIELISDIDDEIPF